MPPFLFFALKVLSSSCPPSPPLSQRKKPGSTFHKKDAAILRAARAAAKPPPFFPPLFVSLFLHQARKELGFLSDIEEAGSLSGAAPLSFFFSFPRSTGKISPSDGAARSDHLVILSLFLLFFCRAQTSEVMALDLVFFHSFALIGQARGRHRSARGTTSSLFSQKVVSRAFCPFPFRAGRIDVMPPTFPFFSSSPIGTRPRRRGCPTCLIFFSFLFLFRSPFLSISTIFSRPRSFFVSFFLSSLLPLSPPLSSSEKPKALSWLE